MCSSLLLVLKLLFKTYIRYDMMGAEGVGWFLCSPAFCS